MFEKSIKEYNRLICEGIKELLGCDAVKSNITADVPKYPFVSFTITNIRTRGGTYGNDGKRKFKSASLSYSFTVQSDDDNQALELAQRLHDWFEEDGWLYFKDNSMVFTSVGPITERDNMITIEYEHRKGFDCVLSLMNFVQESSEFIEHFEPKKV